MHGLITYFLKSCSNVDKNKTNVLIIKMHIKLSSISQIRRSEFNNKKESRLSEEDYNVGKD